jgi:predicted nicotinamide N-methyase
MQAGMKGIDAVSFIHANTELLAPPLTPEIVLHLAAESLPIWKSTEEELGEMNVPPPYWAFAWAGGQALARYVLDNPESVAGKSVVDLGAGSGLVAIAAARAGAASVLAIDIDALAAAAIELNAAANGVRIVASCRNVFDEGLPAAEVLLVGDLFYERELANSVLELIEAVAREGTDVLVGDPRRSYFPVERFDQVASYEVPVTRELEDAEIKRTAVWRLSMPPARSSFLAAESMEAA